MIYVSIFFKNTNIPTQYKVGLRLGANECRFKAAQEFLEDIAEENRLNKENFSYEVYESLYPPKPNTGKTVRELVKGDFVTTYKGCIEMVQSIREGKSVMEDGIEWKIAFIKTRSGEHQANLGGVVQ